MRALIVERDDDLRTALQVVCKAGGIEPAFYTDSGEEACVLASTHGLDAMILAAVNDMKQNDIIRKIRSRKNKIAVVVVGPADRRACVLALVNGADDYVSIPLDGEELTARIKAVVRRYNSHASNLITIGDLAVDLDRQSATVRGESVSLSRKEYGLLELLTLRSGYIVAKETIMNHLYGGRDEPDGKIIDIWICKLRKRLATHPGGAGIITTVWNRGVMIEDRA